MFLLFLLLVLPCFVNVFFALNVIFLEASLSLSIPTRRVAVAVDLSPVLLFLYPFYFMLKLP